jgi:hypothetical protein
MIFFKLLSLCDNWEAMGNLDEVLVCFGYQRKRLLTVIRPTQLSGWKRESGIDLANESGCDRFLWIIKL